MRNKNLFKTVASGDVMSGSADAGVLKLLDTANDILIVDVKELTNITAVAIQVVDNGTATLLIEASYDLQTSWAPITSGTLSEASFAAFNGAAVALGVSDARGMALQPSHIRARLTAVSGGGTYSLAVSGQLLDESR
jgi:hypothetical protein